MDAFLDETGWVREFLQYRMFSANVRCYGIARRCSREISPNPSNPPLGSTIGDQVFQQLGVPWTIEPQGQNSRAVREMPRRVEARWWSGSRPALNLTAEQTLPSKVIDPSPDALEVQRRFLQDSRQGACFAG